MPTRPKKHIIILRVEHLCEKNGQNNPRRRAAIYYRTREKYREMQRWKFPTVRTSASDTLCPAAIRMSSGKSLPSGEAVEWLAGLVLAGWVSLLISTQHTCMFDTHSIGAWDQSIAGRLCSHRLSLKSREISELPSSVYLSFVQGVS